MFRSPGSLVTADLALRSGAVQMPFWFRGLRWSFGGMLVLIVLPSGASEGPTLHVLACGFFALAALASIFVPVNPKIRPAFQVALWCAAILGLWIIVQSLGFAGNPFANPVWKEAVNNYGPMPASISIAPGDTLQGLIAALLPFAVFLTVLLIFPNDGDAQKFVRFIALCGSLICLAGLMQFLFFPHTLLVFEKKFYLDSLTAVFVNRNTAATYIAMIAILNAGFLFHYLQNGGLGSFARFVIGAPNSMRSTDALHIVVAGAAFLVTILCLMLTQSRAGIASGLSGLFLMAAILGAGGSRHRGSGMPGQSIPLWKAAARTALILGVVVLAGLVFASQAILRAGVQGATDLRFCFLPSLLDIARDNWLLGTGFATFPDVFPAYRNPACGLDGVLVMAHNFYLEGLITLGLPFAAITVLVVGTLVVLLAKGVRDRRQLRWLPVAGLAILLLQVMHNSVDFSIQNPGVAATTAAVLAATIVVARGRLSRKLKTHPSMTAFSEEQRTVNLNPFQ